MYFYLISGRKWTVCLPFFLLKYSKSTKIANEQIEKKSLTTNACILQQQKVYFSYFTVVFIMSLNDLRVKWLKSTISNLMGIAEPQYVNHLIRNHNVEFQQFFDAEHIGIKDINQIVVFVWRTFYDKLVEEEITVLEEGIYL